MRSHWLALALSLVSAPALAGNWIGTWSASPQPTWHNDFPLPANVPTHLTDQTVRQFARISVGGKRLRIVLSNAYGTAPLTIDELHVALDGTDRTVTFDGKPSATLAPGAPAISDPIELAAPALATVAVSLYVRDKTPIATFHWDGGQTALVAQGNRTGDAQLAPHSKLTARIFLSDILVERDSDTPTVVAIGDSITDGAGSTLDANHRWPDFLAARLAPDNIAVLNTGISGGRLLHDGMGAAMLARLDRDVLARPQVKTAVVLIGINDISWAGHKFAPDEPRPTVEAITGAYRQLIERMHARGVRVVGATLTPFEGALADTDLAGYHAADKDRLRQAVNQWIRTSGTFDAVIDFDALLRDPQHPGRFLPAYDSGDHLHPGDEGYRAMAQALDNAVLFGAKAR